MTPCRGRGPSIRTWGAFDADGLAGRTYRFFFYSNEGREPPHIHVKAGGDEAKFWLDPIALASNHGFNGRELGEIEGLIAQHRTEFLEAWHEHFG